MSEDKKIARKKVFSIGMRGMGAAAVGVSLVGFLGVMLSAYAGDGAERAPEAVQARAEHVYPADDDGMRSLTESLLAEQGATLDEIAPASGEAQ